MREYRVTAQRGDDVASFGLAAASDETAMVEASFAILRAASEGPDRNIWARGAITLTDPFGTVLAEMGAK